jgi:hypothetical protein
MCVAVLNDKFPSQPKNNRSFWGEMATWASKIGPIGPLFKPSSLRGEPSPENRASAICMSEDSQVVAEARPVSSPEDPKITSFQRNLKALPAELRIEIYDYIIAGGTKDNHEDLTLSVPGPYSRSTRPSGPGQRGASITESYFPWIRVKKGLLPDAVSASYDKGSALGMALGEELCRELASRIAETSHIMVEGVFSFSTTIFNSNRETVEEKVDNLKDSLTKLLATPSMAISTHSADGHRTAAIPNKTEILGGIDIDDTAFWLARMRRCMLTLRLNGDMLCHLFEHRRSWRTTQLGVEEALAREQQQVSLLLATEVIQKYMAAIETLFSRSHSLKDLRIVIDVRDAWSMSPAQDYGLVATRRSLFCVNSEVAGQWFAPLLDVSGFTKLVIEYKGYDFGTFGRGKVAREGCQCI